MQENKYKVYDKDRVSYIDLNKVSYISRIRLHQRKTCGMVFFWKTWTIEWMSYDLIVDGKKLTFTSVAVDKAKAEGNDLREQFRNSHQDLMEGFLK